MHLQFADDKVIIADDFAEMESMLQELEAVCEQVGLRMNYEKISFMINLVPGRNSKVREEEIGLVKVHISRSRNKILK